VRTPNKSYEPPSKPYEPTAKPYEPTAEPYEAPSKPYEPTTKPYDPASKPYEPQLPARTSIEVTIATDSVLGVALDSTISSETAQVEDRVRAHVSRDVLVDGRTAIPEGARLEGVVTEVTRGGKFKERPRVGLTFETLILADGTQIALSTDTVFRDGEAPKGVNAKVGGAGVVGAILGSMIGGKKGAVLGGAAGAAGGAAAVAAGDRAEVVLTSGAALTVRLTSPITVIVERHHDLSNNQPR
jgi:hypothetical protein